MKKRRSLGGYHRRYSCIYIYFSPTQSRIDISNPLLFSCMKRTIRQHKFYEMAVDPSINRFYLRILGFWRSKEEVSGYLPDLEKALSEIQPGFTLLTDLSEMKTHPAEVQELHLQAQALLLRKGLRQTAEVYASSFVQFQTSAISKKSTMPSRQFESHEAAEGYLDVI